MRRIDFRLWPVVAALVLIPALALPDVLEIKLHPDEVRKEPFKPGEGIRFQITNNAPKGHSLNLIVSMGNYISHCDTIAANSNCELTVTPDQSGMLEVSAETTSKRYRTNTLSYSVALRVATYNLSFDRTCAQHCTDSGKKRCAEECPSGFDVLKEQMALPPRRQKKLIDKYRNSEPMQPEEEALAKAAIQIRNVAEVIQRVNPDLLVLAEFDNDGIGKDMTAINDFQQNYLNKSQNNQKALNYPHTYSAPTNTGKPSGFDLDNDGSDEGPNDAWGHGYYHGQYTFAVFSKFKLETSAIRTFQNFRWKDMPSAKNPEIDICDDPVNKPLPDGMKCGDPWYSAHAWKFHPLSSKNHVDIPVQVPAGSGTETLHFLVSHPTPPIFDASARRNVKRNQQEIQFWTDYISGENYFTDDNNLGGGLQKGSYFVIAGDLNADPDEGDGHRPTIKGLITHQLVKKEATTGSMRPTSKGGQEYLNSPECSRNCKRADGHTITSVSGLRLDHVIPSANLKVLKTGVFWPASHESGHHLVYDASLGSSKGVSSDHRMVWVDLYIPVENPGKKAEL